MKPRGSARRLRARCPACNAPLSLREAAATDDEPPVGDPYGCECGVLAWVVVSQVDGQPFVVSFKANRPLGVRNVRR